jgi:hypothetical protein
MNYIKTIEFQIILIFKEKVNLSLNGTDNFDILNNEEKNVRLIVN